jgi:hypothetical protein
MYGLDGASTQAAEAFVEKVETAGQKPDKQMTAMITGPVGARL